MTKFFRYFMRGAALVSLLAVEVPKMLADGQITVAELATFAVAVLEIGGWKQTIDVPDDIGNLVLGTKIE